MARFKGLRIGLQASLIASYGLLAILSVAAVSLAANLFLESRFSQYVKERIKTEEAQTLQNLRDAWEMSGAWNHDELSIIGMNALGRGFIVRVDDGAGNLVWDARTHNNGMCQQILATLARNMDSRFPSWNGAYQETAFPVLVDGTSRGIAWIGFYGPFYYNDAELYFLSSLNQVVVMSAIVAAILAIVLGMLMARRISRPLSKVTATAHALRQGGLTARIENHSPIREIADLSASINSLAQTLGEQEFLRRRLSTDVSHELRTPLSSLQGSLEAMIDGIWPADAKRLELCRDEVLRLSRLIGQIEGLAAIEAGQSQPHWAKVDIDLIVERCCANFQPDFAKKGIAFSWSAEPLQFVTDADKLTQIMVNLLSNALKYTDGGGRVRLELVAGQVVKSQSWLEIAVSDTGIGIPESDLPHIFERLYRVDGSRTRSTGGSGIGLTIAQSLAEQMGGQIVATSQLGQGSRFVLRLPQPETPA